MDIQDNIQGDLESDQIIFISIISIFMIWGIYFCINTYEQTQNRTSIKYKKQIANKSLMLQRQMYLKQKQLNNYQKNQIIQNSRIGNCESILMSQINNEPSSTVQINEQQANSIVKENKHLYNQIIKQMYIKPNNNQIDSEIKTKSNIRRSEARQFLRNSMTQINTIKIPRVKSTIIEDDNQSDSKSDTKAVINSNSNKDNINSNKDNINSNKDNININKDNININKDNINSNKDNININKDNININKDSIKLNFTQKAHKDSSIFNINNKVFGGVVKQQQKIKNNDKNQEKTNNNTNNNSHNNTNFNMNNTNNSLFGHKMNNLLNNQQSSWNNNCKKQQTQSGKANKDQNKGISKNQEQKIDKDINKDINKDNNKDINKDNNKDNQNQKSSMDEKNNKKQQNSINDSNSSMIIILDQLSKVPSQKNKLDQQLNQRKITTAQQYIQKYLIYSKSVISLIQIATKINNFGGARSEPQEIYKFTKAYLTTIDHSNPKQIITFSAKIFEVIMFSSIRTINKKEGFQKMVPPREKNKQMFKNALNTYILIINIIRSLGHQQIWVSIVSKTMAYLDFLFKRKQPINKFQDLDLIHRKFITLSDDVTYLYISRIDFLTYFLVGLLTVDPKQAFREIQSVTNQKFSFEDELIHRNKFKWSYNQFWCFLQAIKNNELQTYWKIPVYINLYSAIYLQIYKYKLTGQRKEYYRLGHWIVKEVVKLSKEKYIQEKNIQQMILENQAFQFDGDEFMDTIRKTGQGFKQKQKDLLKANAQQFKIRNSIFYYFWRKQN